MRVPNTQLRLIAMAPLVAIAILSIGNRIGAAGKQDDFGVPPGSAAPRSSPSPIFPIQKPDIPVARPDLASHLGDRSALARTNFALASNGGVASASSSFPGSAPSGAIDGDRRGLNFGKDGYWNSNDATSPHWLDVYFSGYKTITEI